MANSGDAGRLASKMIGKIRPRFESLAAAEVWYRSEPLPGFSGKTAAQLVESGRSEEFLDYLKAVDAGVYS